VVTFWCPTEEKVAKVIVFLDIALSHGGILVSNHVVYNNKMNYLSALLNIAYIFEVLLLSSLLRSCFLPSLIGNHIIDVAYLVRCNAKQ